MSTIRITAEGNNAAGKTTILSLIAAMLKEKGFAEVVVVNGEETPEVFLAKGEETLNKHPRLRNNRIELIESFGRIE
jgi:thymidylate kinase